MNAPSALAWAPPHPPAPLDRERPLQLLDAMVGACVALAVFGYPIASALPMFLAQETRVISVPYRAFVAALTVAVLALALLNRRRTRVPLYVSALCAAACLVLTARFAYDGFVLGAPVSATQSVSEFAQFFYGVTLLPALALLVPLRADAERRVFTCVLAFGVATVMLVVFAVNFLNPDADPAARADLEGLNAISYATTGACVLLLLASMPARSRASGSRWLFMACGAALALVPLLTAASRGPILCLVIAWSIFRVVSSKGSRGLIVLAMILVLAVTALLAATWASLAVDADADDAAIIARRLTDVSGDSSTVERLVILGSSWDVFAASPLLGGAMVEPILHAYPHNVLLEALMVGGLPFGALTLLLLTATALQALRLMGPAVTSPLRRFAGLFTLYVLAMSMLSGSLYRGPELWAMVVLCFAFGASARPAFARSTRRPVADPALRSPTEDVGAQ